MTQVQEQRSWDEVRFSIAVQALADHAHTVLEAHAEVPQDFLQPVQDTAFALQELLVRLDTLGDES